MIRSGWVSEEVMVTNSAGRIFGLGYGGDHSQSWAIKETFQVDLRVKYLLILA
jgi:hypothetical protein